MLDDVVLDITATPHPSLPDNTLYRHIDANEPPPIRFLTLVSWAARRFNDDLTASIPAAPLFPSSSSTSDQAISIEDRAKRKAAQAISQFIDDVCNKRVDVNWLSSTTATEAPKKDETTLLPNPENEALQRKMTGLDQWIARFVLVLDLD